jgi:acylphosphatase
MTDKNATVHLRVTGRVQGVYFRAWAADKAKARQLSGWVRNRRDGSVEALFHGAADQVAAMVELCRKGPPQAEVARIEINPSLDSPPSGFSILPTA